MSRTQILLLIERLKVELHFLKQRLIVYKKKIRVWIDVLKEDIKPHIRDASIRLQPKREASVAWYLKSPFKVRGSALNTNANNLSQAEALTADTLFIMDEESDPVSFFLICFHMKSGKVVIIDNSSIEDDLTTRQRYFKLPQELISVFDEYISKNSPERRASVEPKRLKMKWRTCENELDNGVFLMSHMDNYFGEAESKWEYGFCKESNEQTKQLKFLRSKYAARILLLENHSYKDEFQKEVDKVRSKDKNTRRELIEEAVLRRPAKVDEYFG
ncbi:hypothetical protein Tco_1483440 [Tanacetum coccineum]